MDSLHRFQENLKTSAKDHSPNSSSCSNSSTTSNGGPHPHHHHHHQPSPPVQIPIPITRSEPNSPYPTTFVQADTTSFKQVVQLLTGSSDTAKSASGSTRTETAPPLKYYSIPPIKSGPRKEKSGSKLYERRNSLKNFKLSPLPSGLVSSKPGFPATFSGSPRPEILSPSLLDFPSLALSPVTPLIPDPFNRSPAQTRPGLIPAGNLNMLAEEKAIVKKGFYLHPSPSSTPRGSEPPRLLPLFPVTSPGVAGSADS